MTTPISTDDISSITNSWHAQHRCYGPKMAVFSGGTGFNGLVKYMSHSLSTNVAHILPISDSGGSTREIIRVLGGPAIGDIRSRLVRLADGFDEHYSATKHVLEHRIQLTSVEGARKEFETILSGEHIIWLDNDGCNTLYTPSKLQIRMQTLLSFIRHFNKCCNEVHQCRDPQPSPSHTNDDISANEGSHHNQVTSMFDFRGGSIGNFVLTGARLFFNSLDCAIQWFSTLAGLPPSASVLPVISGVSNRVTIAALLKNGDIIFGQNEISHPTPPLSSSSEVISNSWHESSKVISNSWHESVSSCNVYDSQQTMTYGEPLSSPISKIIYTDEDCDSEVAYSLNPFVVDALRNVDAIVSILYCIVLYVIVVAVVVVVVSS